MGRELGMFVSISDLPYTDVTAACSGIVAGGGSVNGDLSS